jgi:hypothetical protein
MGSPRSGNPSMTLVPDGLPRCGQLILHTAISNAAVKYFVALICFAMGIGFYGLLIAWMNRYGNLSDVSELPYTLRRLGWQAQAYLAVLVVLGTLSLATSIAAINLKR